MNHPLDPLFREHHASAIRWLHRHYPGLPAEDVEDAVSAAWLDLLERPRLTQGRAPWTTRSLHRTVAWRRLRGLCRRAWRQHEDALPSESSPRLGRAPGQSALDRLPQRVERAMAAAVQLAGRGREEQLRRALEERILGGGTDVAVARRFGVRREVLNRARQVVLRAVEDGYGV